MNQRIVLGLLIAGGLGIGLFSAVERLMRRAGRQVTEIEQPPSEPVQPVTLVSAPPRKPELPRPAPNPAPAPVPNPALPVAVARPEPVRQPAPVPVKGAPVIEKLAICLGVKDRNPVNETATVAVKSGRVYCWMRVASASGKKVRPVWTINGKTTTGNWIAIGSNQFRTWTAKRIDASSVGPAKLEVQDDKGRVIATREFSVVK
ncbi:MAG: DUF2914 domain-containing protein [Planctomycetia bacterium]|nr:DUF2914 domain-containing protein [Planctomycetia bacterium]